MTELPKAFSPEQLAELLSDAGRAEMARPAPMAGDRSAEMISGITPAWYVIETYPQCEHGVAHELVARRFGIFLPEIEETVVRRGRKFDRKALMFTRYIFVFTWLNDQNYSLIKNTKDVFRFASAEGKAPLVVTDAEIDLLRRVENGKRPFTVVFDDNEPPAFLSKKARARWKPRVFNPKKDILRSRAWSAFDDGFTALDTEQRNQTLEKALGLAPSTCP
jgi:transcription antitermination factor NusG